MSDGLVALTVVTAVGCAAGAGALFAFSSFVMPALARLSAAQGIAAMQSINVHAPTPVFMTALFGPGLTCIALAVWALADWDDSYGPYLLAGSALYLLGPVGLTIVYHVPRNNALARLDAAAADAESHWRRYVTEWTRGNHVRSTAGLAVVGLLALALHFG